MRTIVAALLVAVSLVAAGAQGDAGLSLVTLADAGSPAPTKVAPKFATPTEGYFHVPVPDTKRDNYVYWLNGSKAERVMDAAGKPLSGEYMPLVENGTHVFALPTLKSGTRAVFMLDKGKAHAIYTEDGKPLTGSNFEAYGPKPEYLQVTDTEEFYRLEGTVAKRLKLPAVQPKMKYPTLVVSPTNTYLYDRNTILRRQPGRLWLITKDGGLSRVKWPNDEEAEFGIALFYDTGKSTYIVMNEYEVQENPDAEYQERYLWKLDGDRIDYMTDGEGDDWWAVSLLTNAVVGERLYLPGLVRNNEETHVWTIAEGGEPSLLKSDGKPLKGHEIDMYAAGDRAVAKRKAAEGDEEEFWVCDGDRAQPIKDAKGNTIKGEGFVKFNKGAGLLALEVEKGTYRLHTIDAKLVAKPLSNGEGYVEGSGELFVPGMSLYAAENGLYCRVVTGKDTSSMYLYGAK
jgi:hypothetical protein